MSHPSDVERMEGQYRMLATKVIYGTFDGTVSHADRARLDQLGEELRRRNAFGSSADSETTKTAL